VADAASSRSATAERLTRLILSAAKYRALDESVVRRAADNAAGRFSDERQALKYAKRKLHQSYGSFLVGSPAQAVTAMAAAVRSGQAGLRQAALRAMRAHASSAERADWLEPFYARVAAWCGAPASVADLGCGLNPLAIPWMTLAPGAAYLATEIDTALVAALAGLGDVMGVRLAAAAMDLLAPQPVIGAELVFMLKLVTTLDQQEAGASGRLLRAVDARHVVLSLPRGSLSGRRGYRNEPGAIVGDVVAGSRYRVAAEAAFGDEAVYYLAEASSAASSATRQTTS